MAKKVDPVLGSVLVRVVSRKAESKARIPVQVINWGSDPTTSHPIGEWVKWDGKEREQRVSIKPGTMHDRSWCCWDSLEKHREWSSGSPARWERGWGIYAPTTVGRWSKIGRGERSFLDTSNWAQSSGLAARESSSGWSHRCWQLEVSLGRALKWKGLNRTWAAHQ